MSGLEMFVRILWQVIWPPSGIILMEEQLLQWGLAFFLVYLEKYSYMLLMIAALYFVIAYVVFSRMPHMQHHTRRLFHFIFTMISVICGAWILLIFGALVGNHGNRGEDVARATMTRRTPIIAGWTIVRNITYISLHFRFGRGIYRFFYRVLGHVGFLAREENLRFREAIARVLALFVIVYGAWDIPYLLTH